MISSGGAWVSLRSRKDIFDRHAREGFWHFPGEPSWGPAEDVVRAAFLTACALPADVDRKRLLDSSSVAVTLFSPWKECTVGELDNDRYGIIVVSGERPEVMGAPCRACRGFATNGSSFTTRAINNGGLYEFEPYILYRHELSKFVEPGASWQPSGVAGTDDSPDCGSLASWTRNLVQDSGNRATFRYPSIADWR